MQIKKFHNIGVIHALYGISNKTGDYSKEFMFGFVNSLNEAYRASHWGFIRLKIISEKKLV